MGVDAVVGQEAVAAGVEPELAGDGADGTHQRRDLGVAGPGREIVEMNVGALGNHQHMDRRLGIDVVEGQDVLVLIDRLARNLFAQDAGEDVAGIVTRDGFAHGSPP